MNTQLIVHALGYLAIAVGVAAAGWLWRLLTSTRAASRLCPRCLYDVAAIGPLSRCPECGLEMQTSGVIAPGTRLRKRVPFVVVSFSILWVFASLWLLLNAALQRLNVLQSEEETYQVQLVCDDPALEIGAGWWRRVTPPRDPVEFVQYQPMRLPGRLVQWYEQGAPSRWEREGRTSADGIGEVPLEEVWALLGEANLNRADPIAIARVEGLRQILLGGRTLKAPPGSPWRDVRAFGPVVDRGSPPLVVGATAALMLAFWGAACLWLAPIWRRRFPTAARRTPLPSAPISVGASSQ